ncbi:MAG: hypothetical protein HQ553_07195 [Chloroflexi bacterium]|nr:hypothetical protein [Chloroflexota bacterium]
MSSVIGIDFDNTLVTYDESIYRFALERCLIQPEMEKNKKKIRDSIRQLIDGENKWRTVQAAVYGPRMEEAQLIDGVKDFFQECKHRGAKIYIVSHKTKYASQDETKTNLREAALWWMKINKFFDSDGLGLRPNEIYFEATLQEKIERIKELECSHFIDDLEETFNEDIFPNDVVKILYATRDAGKVLSGVCLLSSWEEISEFFFGNNSGFEDA